MVVGVAVVEERDSDIDPWSGTLAFLLVISIIALELG